MRIVLMALPCLLVSGLAMAKEHSRPQQGANDVLLASALDAAAMGEGAVVSRAGFGDWEAAQRKGSKPAPAPKPAAAPTDTSKRFLMTQGGKQMTADDFDAWMKKNGYRVATGAPAKAEEPAKKAGK